MRRSVLRAASLTFAVAVLGTVVVHAALSAGCKSEGGIAADPSNPATNANATADTPSNPNSTAPATANANANPSATATANSKSTAKPTPRYMPATKAAPVFRDDDWSAPQQQAPQPPAQQKSNAGNR